MKTNKVLIVIAAICLMFATQSCKSHKSIAKAEDSKEVILPFAGAEYQSDNDNLRAVSSGHSPDLATSQKIALQNAEAKMAGVIKTVLSSAARQYTDQSSIGNKQDYENKFDEQIWSFVNQTMYNLNVKGERAFEHSDKGGSSYFDWICIQESKADLMAGMNSRISSNEQLKLNYDQQKFSKDVDAEMHKMQTQQDSATGGR